MKLTLEQTKNIAKGVARVEEIDGKIAFFRFTKEQELSYGAWDTDFYKKTFATAGVRLEFETDSTSLFIKTCSLPASSRRFFGHDIFVNGKLIASLSKIFEDSLAPIRATTLSGKYDLGQGLKRVCIYFPWSFASRLCELSLDDGATLTPVNKKRKMIMLGDSITHGYDAQLPSNSYSSRLADFLDADALNKAIGGEKFRPELALLKDDFEPDIITVAYGTNDWNSDTKEKFDMHCKDFYDNLARSYPNSKIFAITPIWRADYMEDKQVGSFSYVAEYMKEITKKHENITVIDGFEFVPQDTSLFSDLFLHPNDEGFEYYAKSICKEIEKYI